MDFKVKQGNPLKVKTNCLVIFYPTKGTTSKTLSLFDKNNDGLVTRILKKNKSAKNSGKHITIYEPKSTLADQIILLSIGDSKELSTKKCKEYVSVIAKIAKDYQFKNLLLDADALFENIGTEKGVRAVIDAFQDNFYSFQTYKSTNKDKTSNILKVFIYSSSNKTITLNRNINKALCINEGIKLTKDLANHPGNICTPTFLAQKAKKMSAINSKLKVKILERKQMERLGMGSLLAVSQGSEEPPKFIIFEYNGTASRKKPTVLVGKGITFDSGGISLKPGAGMDEMKYDMGGAAAVFGCVHAIASLDAKVNLIALVPAVENMPDGKAIKPGDIVRSMSGKTIEILNTDAEGRLILCDALTYSERYNPDVVIDIATLTGACIVALGKHASGLLSNDDSLAEDLLKAGKQVNDRAWRLPLWEEYKQQIQSPFADIANVGGRGAGTITAAVFLSYFAEKFKWAHLDIAGTAWHSGASKGASGRPVPLLTEFVLSKE